MVGCVCAAAPLSTSRSLLVQVSRGLIQQEDRGLVERSPDPGDRRRTLVSIADEHRAGIRAIFDQRLRPLDRTLRRLEPDERGGLIAGLMVLAEELDRANAETTKETTR